MPTGAGTRYRYSATPRRCYSSGAFARREALTTPDRVFASSLGDISPRLCALQGGEGAGTLAALAAAFFGPDADPVAGGSAEASAAFGAAARAIVEEAAAARAAVLVGSGGGATEVPQADDALTAGLAGSLGRLSQAAAASTASAANAADAADAADANTVAAASGSTTAAAGSAGLSAALAPAGGLDAGRLAAALLPPSPPGLAGAPFFVHGRCVRLARHALSVGRTTKPAAAGGTAPLTMGSDSAWASVLSALQEVGLQENARAGRQIYTSAAALL